MRTLENLWSESEMVKKFGQTRKGEDKNIEIGRWIAKGLAYISLSGRKYFWEDDVVEFLEGFKKQRSQSPESQ